MGTPSVPILTYHSQNVRGAQAAENDHVGLAEDLETLHRHGRRVIPLVTLLDWLDGFTPDTSVQNSLCITFDDGCDLDVRDIEFPGHGVQRSFLGIMQQFKQRHGHSAQPGLHATAFVIASSTARSAIDARSLFGQGWMSDDWWAAANDSKWLTIGNHGWDHNHPDVNPEQSGQGGFTMIDSLEQCVQQVVTAARFIEDNTGAWPDVFAYPYGESSTYIREEFFPRHGELHRCRAAVGTQTGKVTRNSDRWNLSRYVRGRDWRSSDGLLDILKDS
jgi:peptidoglycan/xylan/chitin deacetylase (PgdA/CDA1 family)